MQQACAAYTQSQPIRPEVRMMLKICLLLSILFAGLSSPGYAQTTGGTQQGTDKERQACTRDVTRHCRPVMKEGDFVVLRCLQENRKKLSQPCLKVLEDHGQ